MRPRLVRDDEVSAQRVLPVCLQQIRPEVRYEAARRAIRMGFGGEELLAVAINPSDEIYWIRLSGAELLRKVMVLSEQLREAA